MRKVRLHFASKNREMKRKWHVNLFACGATEMSRNKQEFIINIYDPFMFIHDYLCSAAGKKRNELP